MALTGASITNLKRSLDKYVSSSIEVIEGVDIDYEGVPFNNAYKRSFVMFRILDIDPVYMRQSSATEYGENVDVLVNGAGINSATPFLEITDEEWERILDTNLKSVRLACQVFGKYMIDRNTRGSIINIASLSGITALSRVFTYAATKAAVINLTQNLAREWAPNGIRVNALSPGFFPAEQNRKVLTPDRVESIMRHTPMQRFGSPEELAGAVLLMASPNAGSYLTGENIVVDGGFTAMTI